MRVDLDGNPEHDEYPRTHPDANKSLRSKQRNGEGTALPYGRIPISNAEGRAEIQNHREANAAEIVAARQTLLGSNRVSAQFLSASSEVLIHYKWKTRPL